MKRLLPSTAALTLFAATLTACGSTGGSGRLGAGGVPYYEWRDLELSLMDTVEVQFEGRELVLHRYSTPVKVADATNYGLSDRGIEICDMINSRPAICEVLDARTGEVLVEKRLERIRFLPGTGFLSLDAKRCVPRQIAERLCAENPSVLNYEHLNIFTGGRTPSNIKQFHIRETRADGRTGWPDRDPSSIDGDGNVRTVEVLFEDRTTPPAPHASRRLQYRELSGRVLVDLPAVWGEPAKLGNFLAINAELEGERRIALLSWCKSDPHWTPAGTNLFHFGGGSAYKDIYRLAAPVPETDAEDDLWLFLDETGGFSAPDGVVGFTPMRSGPRAAGDTSHFLECEWIWLVRYPVDNERDPLAQRWGLMKTFTNEYTPPIWTHYQVLHDQFAVDVATKATPAAERDAFGYACETKSFIALKDIDEDWHLVDSNPRFDYLDDRSTRARAYQRGSSGDFERIDAVITREKRHARRRVDQKELREAVKERDGRAIEFWAIRVGDNSVYDLVRITYPDASQEMLAAAISALQANGYPKEAGELSDIHFETQQFIARAQAARAQREALFARLAAEERARTESRRRAHAASLHQPSSSASWGSGKLPRWGPSENQKMQIYRHNLDRRIREAAR